MHTLQKIHLLYLSIEQVIICKVNKNKRKKCETTDNVEENITSSFTCYKRNTEGRVKKTCTYCKMNVLMNTGQSQKGKES